MPKKEVRTTTEPDPAEAPQPPGDNRRAGDTDGNASDGSTKSKGATNPAEEPAAKRKE